MSSKLLVFLASDQNIPQGIVLKDKKQKNSIGEKLESSDLAITLISSEEAKTKLPDINTAQYDLIISGKPRDLMEANNLIISDIEKIEALSKDEPMNTVFGRLYEVARKKLPSLKL